MFTFINTHSIPSDKLSCSSFAMVKIEILKEMFVADDKSVKKLMEMNKIAMQSDQN